MDRPFGPDGSEASFRLPVISFAIPRASFEDACLFRKSQREVVKHMAISQDLLEILACPACKAKVELKPDGSGLKCVECRRVYPIRDDIPVMLIDEAAIENESTSPPPAP